MRRLSSLPRPPESALDEICEKQNTNFNGHPFDLDLNIGACVKRSAEVGQTCSRRGWP